jgi:hypothetical protein
MSKPETRDDLVAHLLNRAAQIPAHDTHTDMAAMQPPYEHRQGAPSGVPTGQQLFAPVASDKTLLGNAPQIQQAPASGELQQTDLLNMQPSYANHLGGLSGASAGQHLFAPDAPNTAPISDTPQNQGAPPPMAPQSATMPAAQQPSQTVNAVPQGGAKLSDYLALQQGRPPQGLIWPADVEIGLIEICTFCPSWFRLPEPAARAIRNGWSAASMGKAQVHALGILDWDEWQRAIRRVQKQISAGCKMIDGTSADSGIKHNSSDFRRRHGPQDDLTANAWRFMAEYEPGAPVKTGHLPLLSIYRNVVNWPVGNDRLLMTQCLEFAKNNEHLEFDTAHWDWIIQSQSLTAPPAPVGKNRDIGALERLHANVANP